MKPRSNTAELELSIRIVVESAPPGVTFAMQCGKSELVGPVGEAGHDLTFEVRVRVAARGGGGPPNILGPYAHGPPTARFLYLNSGTLAGQSGTGWTRRAKIRTAGISWELIAELAENPGSVLLVHVHGQAKDGGPCCATVPLLHGGWRVHAVGRSVGT